MEAEKSFEKRVEEWRALGLWPPTPGFTVLEDETVDPEVTIKELRIRLNILTPKERKHVDRAIDALTELHYGET